MESKPLSSETQEEIWEAIKWAQATCDVSHWGRFVLVIADNQTQAAMLAWHGAAWQAMGQIVADVCAMTGDPGYALGEPRMTLPDMSNAAERWLESQGYSVSWRAPELTNHRQ